MTKVRKFLGAVMAAMLCFALTPAAAFAASGTNDNDGKITVDKAVNGQTYSVYEIFKLESYSYDDSNPIAGAYSYVPTDNWKNWLESETASKYVTINENRYVTWKEGASAADFAAAAIKYAKEGGPIAPDRTVTAQGGQAIFEQLNLGYYLVDSSVGALCALNTTAKEATITEKNDAPSVEKKVQENSTGLYGDSNDAAIGEEVNFQATITAQPGAANYIFHDYMCDGLTFDPNSVKVSMGETELGANNYTIVTENLADTLDSDIVGSPLCKFEIRFTDVFNQSIVNKNTAITINYSATLNERALVGEANKNIVKLTYGDKSKLDTSPSETSTFTWKMPVFKYTDTGTETPLAGAKFTLSKVVSNDELEQIGDPVTTDATGRFEFSGLDSGKYKLTEDVAPNGYNKLAGPLTVVIDEEGNIFVDDDTQATSEVKVLNQTGAQLPSTGGIGTTIFYIVGGLLVVGAVVFFVRRRSHATK